MNMLSDAFHDGARAVIRASADIRNYLVGPVWGGHYDEDMKAKAEAIAKMLDAAVAEMVPLMVMLDTPPHRDPTANLKEAMERTIEHFRKNV
jgi:hypothetical protein